MSEPTAAASPGASSEVLAAAIPELTELGQRLRRAREGRGIGVAELADRLHLAPEQLTALESGDRSHLREPVFVIAQAKRVAEALGVDVSEQVESLRRSPLMRLPTPGAPGGTPTAAAAARPAAPPPAPVASTPRARRLALAALPVLLALLAGLLTLRPWSQPRPAAGPSTGAGSTATGRTDGGRPAATQSQTPATAPGVLVLRSDEPSWVEVRDREGQVLFSGLLEKEARFRLGEGLRVLAGRPDLVTAAVAGGAPRRLGSISEVGWQDFAPPEAASPSPRTAPEPAPKP